VRGEILGASGRSRRGEARGGKAVSHYHRQSSLIVFDALCHEGVVSYTVELSYDVRFNNHSQMRVIVESVRIYGLRGEPISPGPLGLGRKTLEGGPQIHNFHEKKALIIIEVLAR